MDNFNAWLIATNALVAYAIVSKEPAVLVLALGAVVNAVVNIPKVR